MGLFGSDKVGISFEGKDQVTPVVRGIQRTMDGFKRDAATGFGLGAGISVFNTAQRAIGAVVDVLGDAVRAAMVEEESIALLTRSIQENDAAWDGNMAAIEAVIAERERLGFADDAQRESLRALVAVTGSSTEALELQRQAMDLARLKGMDLATASNLLGKVYAGNLGILSRYGIQLEEGATATEALAEIQRRARGQAEAYAETTQGKLVRAQIALDNAMERVGASLLPVVAGMADLAADVIPEVVDASLEVVDLFADMARDLLPDLGEAIGGVGLNLDTLGADFGELRDTVNETIGRDVVNDFANFARIAGTFGFVLVSDAAGTYGVAVEDAARITGDFIGDVNRAAPTIDQMVQALHGSGVALKGVSGTTKDASAATATLRRETLDMAAATGIAVRGYQAEQKELKDLIGRADELAGTRDKTADRLGQLAIQEQRLHERMADAARRGMAASVAAYQGAIDKNEEMQGSLLATQRLLERMASIQHVIRLTIVSRTLNAFGGGLFSSATGGGGLGSDPDPDALGGSGAAERRAARRAAQRAAEARARREEREELARIREQTEALSGSIGGSAAATDQKTAADDRKEKAATAAAKAEEALAREYDRVSEAAGRVAEAVTNIGKVAFADMATEAQARLAELRASLEAQIDPVRVMQDEVAALKALRAEAEAAGRVDLMATIDLRLQELEVMAKQYQMMKVRYAEEHTALDILTEKLDISVRKAKELLETYRTKADVEDSVTDEELARLIIKVRKRAKGGPVSAGGTYLVGEGGPELLTMGSTSGHVTPNHAMGGGGDVYLDGFLVGRIIDERMGRQYGTASRVSQYRRSN